MNLSASKNVGIRVWLCCIAFVLLSACNIDREEGASTNLFEFTRDGGIVGWSQRIVVDPKGRITVTDMGESREVELSESELERIVGLVNTVDAPAFTDAPPDRSDECCDRVYSYVAVRGKYLDLSGAPAETRDAIIQALEPLLVPPPGEAQ